MDIDWKDAIDYLRKEAIVLPADAPRGIVLLTYKGFALGFAKNLGNRANNLYPQEWRIKSTHVPIEECGILNVECGLRSWLFPKGGKAIDCPAGN